MATATTMVTVATDTVTGMDMVTAMATAMATAMERVTVTAITAARKSARIVWAAWFGTSLWHRLVRFWVFANKIVPLTKPRISSTKSYYLCYSKLYQFGVTERAELCKRKALLVDSPKSVVGRKYKLTHWY